MSPACEVVWSAWARLFTGPVYAGIELLPIIVALMFTWRAFKNRPWSRIVRWHDLRVSAALLMLAALARVPMMLSHLLDC